MKGMHHLCYTSHQEVICRNSDDYETLVCRIAQTAITTSSQILAYAVMSTHVHIILQTDSPSEFCSRLRHSYTCSFNYKYGRKGRLGEKMFYSIQLGDIVHTTAAISYVLRNPVHHNVTANPFSYPYSSTSLYFRSKVERMAAAGMEGEAHQNSYTPYGRLSRNSKVPKNRITFLNTGRVNPLSFVEVGMVENYFGTYNAFQYSLHRRDFQEWTKSQMEAVQDKEPVTLRRIEPWIEQSRIDAFESRSPHWYKEEQVSDLQLCMEIDKEVRFLQKNSYIQLSDRERMAICRKIRMRMPTRISEEQFARCIGGRV